MNPAAAFWIAAVLLALFPVAQAAEPTPETTPDADVRVADTTGAFSLLLPEGWFARPLDGRIDFANRLDALAFEALPAPGTVSGVVIVAPADTWSAFIASTADPPDTPATPSPTPDAGLEPRDILDAVQAGFGTFFDRPTFEPPVLFVLGGAPAALMFGTASGGDLGLVARAVGGADGSGAPAFALVAFSAAPGELDLLAPDLQALAASVRCERDC